MAKRSLVERERAFQCTDNLRAAGMADEPVDVFHRKAHSGENFDHGGVEMPRDEVGYRATKDDAKSFRVDIPSHDAERIRPKVFAGSLALGSAAIAPGQT